jgi:hypothetical protein
MPQSGNLRPVLRSFLVIQDLWVIREDLLHFFTQCVKVISS